MLTKQEADNLMKIKGNVRGAVFYTHAVYIHYREGEKGIKTVEGKMGELGYPVKFGEIQHLGWYPESLSALTIIVAKEVFNWTEKDLFNMGNSAPKYSFIVRLLMKYFLSPRRTFAECPEYWQKHFDFGSLEPREFNEKERYVILRINGYKFHPFLCVYHAGYMLRIGQYVLNSKKIAIKEIKCMFGGDPYHEYMIRWE